VSIYNLLKEFNSGRLTV